MELRMLHFQAHESRGQWIKITRVKILISKKKKKSSEINQTFDNSNFYKYIRYLLGLADNMILFLPKLLSHFTNAFKYRINSRHFARASYRLFHSWTARFLKGQDEKCCTMYGSRSSSNLAQRNVHNASQPFAARQRWWQNITRWFLFQISFNYSSHGG